MKCKKAQRHLGFFQADVGGRVWLSLCVSIIGILQSLSVQSAFNLLRIIPLKGVTPNTSYHRCECMGIL
ncbi:hypothetical protein JT254_04415 [Helicobacter pylori]|nr:hypothetical protein [Helicobacter pylori]